MKIKINSTTYHADIKPPTRLIDVCYQQSLPINFGCRIGMCGTCIVKIKAGAENISPKNFLEEEFGLLTNERLACQCLILGDVELE